MLYLDNAATSCPKPPEVGEAIVNALNTYGGPGRGAHVAAVASAMGVYDARVAVADLLGVPDPDRVSLTPNVTQALNMAIDGLLPDGGIGVTTAAAHNSVLRPLYKARDERGCEMRIVPVDETGAVDMDEYRKAVEGADLVVVTHASNVTGDIYDIPEQAGIAHDAGATVVLDAAQTAGSIPMDMGELGVDVLCFTGHKGLLGPQGTGGLCAVEGVEVPPLMEGGSGSHSFDKRQARHMPESLEAGTINAHGFAGLSAGIGYIQDEGVENIAAKESQLANKLIEAVEEMDGVHVVGGGGIGRTGIVTMKFDNADASSITSRLSTEYGICTRGGAHCAPLMHEALGTAESGVVRVSFGPFNEEGDVDEFLAALKEILATE